MSASVTFNALLNYILDKDPDDPLILLSLWREGSFDEVREGWPDIPAAVFPKPDLHGVEQLEKNVRVLLDGCPYTVRDMSGDFTGMRGREYLPGSLGITFLGMQQRLKEAEAKAKA